MYLKKLLSVLRGCAGERKNFKLLSERQVVRSRTISCNIGRFWLVAPLALLLSACSTLPHVKPEIPNNEKVYDDPIVYFGNNYLISPGDQIEVIYHVDIEQQDQYTIAIGDQIRVEFYYYPQLDRTLNVRPDGKVTIPYKGDLSAAGLTPEQLGSRIDAAYSDFLQHPKSTISLIRYGERIRELKDSIRTASRGQSRLLLVQPDGRISLPFLKPFRVAGRSIGDVEVDINDQYGEVIEGMFTTATLHTVTGNRVYVFGAVNDPGFYQLTGPTTVAQSIAMADGFRDLADIQNVLLISRDEENRAVGRVIDLKAILKTGNASADVLLRQADVIYVPLGALGKGAIVGSALTRMIPLSFGLFYDINPT